LLEVVGAGGACGGLTHLLDGRQQQADEDGDDGDDDEQLDQRKRRPTTGPDWTHEPPRTTVREARRALRSFLAALRRSNEGELRRAARQARGVPAWGRDPALSDRTNAAKRCDIFTTGGSRVKQKMAGTRRLGELRRRRWNLRALRAILGAEPK